MPDLIHGGVEYAALLLNAFEALLRIRAVAEQVIENNAGIYLHGQRSSWGPPRDRIHVSATEAHIARTHQTTEIFGSEFQRGQRSFLANPRGRDLIDSHAGLNVRAVGPLGMHSVQEDCRGASVIAAIISGTARRRHLMRKVGNHD